MELKKFQQKTIDDLILFLDLLNTHQHADIAYEKFWELKDIIVGLNGLEKYKNNIKNVPHICFKVPTGGGKTFLACNAIKPIFDAMPCIISKTVVWLVPSNTILEQTINNLKDPSHPYRQRINTHFNNRVEVYSKTELLFGKNFNCSVVNEQLNILVLSFDTFRSRKKEDRKIYQENGYLKDFVNRVNNRDELIKDVDETALIQVINQLNPLVIVDESHNAETELSIEMLRNLNPCFILDLTATPRKNSNIITFVDSLQLKKEKMVKIPVIVYNHQNKEDVIIDAITLRNNLEIKAIEEEKINDKYIRPIVLFQAQPKGNEDNKTFHKLKADLIEMGIPEDEIAIKTSNINELKNVNLMNKNCKIKYIITINALKEGWDCPFAYILATLTHKSSRVDIEQILGRILRQPYTKEHSNELLNLSYVFTCSNDFQNTLNNIISGLNKSGFSKKDYRLINKNIMNISNESADNEEDTDETPKLIQLPIEDSFVTDDNNSHETEEFDTDESLHFEVDKVKTSIMTDNTLNNTIIDLAQKEGEKFNNILNNMIDNEPFFNTELNSKKNNIYIKEAYKNQILEIKIPQFFMKSAENTIFGISDILLTKENLLDNFTLKNKDTIIELQNIDTEMYEIDLEQQQKGEFVPRYLKLNNKDAKIITEFLSRLPEHKKMNQYKELLFKQLGKIDTLSDTEIKDYIKRILDTLNTEQLNSLNSSIHKYAKVIKQKIKKLEYKHRYKEFFNRIEKEQIICKENYTFKNVINPTKIIENMAKSLYEAEENMNNFENMAITRIASLDNVLFWHRNIMHKEFCINGFTNHFPDFIVMTKSKKIIVIETKGDYLTNDMELNKLSLGRKWAQLAGENYRYYMVFEDKSQRIDGAYTLNEFIDIIKDL
ncbi:DEAD/DEAH box helicase family protein [Vallitalea sediminicola]